MKERQKRQQREAKQKRVQDTRNFIESREHACPFAAEAEHGGQVQYVSISELGPEVAIRQGVREFIASSKKALVLLFPESTHRLPLDMMIKRAVDYFTEAGAAMIETYNPGISRSEVKEIAEREFRSILEDPDSDIIPHIGHPEKGGMYTIFMGAYERPHPRWAPHPMLVLTWISDVEAAQLNTPLMVERIRERVFREFGAPYDAKALALPQRPDDESVI